MHFPQIAIGQQKHLNLDALWQRKQTCEPAKKNLFKSPSVTKETKGIQP